MTSGDAQRRFLFAHFGCGRTKCMKVSIRHPKIEVAVIEVAVWQKLTPKIMAYEGQTVLYNVTQV